MEFPEVNCWMSRKIHIIQEVIHAAPRSGTRRIPSAAAIRITILQLQVTGPRGNVQPMPGIVSISTMAIRPVLQEMEETLLQKLSELIRIDLFCDMRRQRDQSCLFHLLEKTYMDMLVYSEGNYCGGVIRMNTKVSISSLTRARCGNSACIAYAVPTG